MLIYGEIRQWSSHKAVDCLLYIHVELAAHDANQLQSDLENLQQWESDRQMHFNPYKCEVIRISPPSGNSAVVMHPLLYIHMGWR